MYERNDEARAPRRAPRLFEALTLGLLTSLAGNSLLGDDVSPSQADLTVQSPDRALAIELSLGAEGRVTYRVLRGSRPVVEASGLGMRFDDDVDGTTGFTSFARGPVTESDSTWRPVWGERAVVRDHFRAATFRATRNDPALAIEIEVRAYDAGVAFRYRIEPPAGAGGIRIESELTEFRFPADHDVWSVTSAQGKYSKVKLSALQHTVERPCVLETSNGEVVAVAEAAVVDYARMRLRRLDGAPNAIVSRLHGPVEVDEGPLVTPWRVVMAADSAGELLERNDIILNLNEPCAIEDTSWIRHGKVIREVSLSTDGGKACVDFAVKYGLQFIEYDAGWYGPERDEASDARTVSRRGLDLQAVIQYAKERGIGVIVYVNRRHLERQLDFLDKGSAYEARIYTHDPSVGTKTKVKIETRSVDTTTRVPLRLSERGGAAMRIVKVTAAGRANP